jgi:hypothetical protein
MVIVGGGGRDAQEVESSLPVVYGYRDVGAMLGGHTRWKPRRVVCTTDAGHREHPGEEYVVKYVQGGPGSAALISEVLSHGLLEAGGLSTLDAALVEVSDRFARSYAQAAIDYRVEAGVHFGTRFRTDVYPAPPESYDDLDDPTELVDIWVFDSWFMNIDRPTHGNLLMYHASSRPVWSLIAVDQSDCFCGAHELHSGRYRNLCCRRGAAATFEELRNRAVLEHGPQCVRRAMDKVDVAVRHLDPVFARVPPNWWAAANVDPQQVAQCLRDRASRLGAIVNIKHWEGLADGIRGGRLLDV